MAVDYEKIWATNGTVTAPSDANYLLGFAQLGSAPPTEELFNFIQQNNDQKMKDLNDRMPDGSDFLPLIGGTDNPMTGPIVGAVGANIASSATLNLAAATGQIVHVTGTTAITAIIMAAGQWCEVIFDGSLTLTHHSTNNNLPGGANITTIAGDRATYWKDGTTVYCVNYQKSDGTAIAGIPSATAAEVKAGTVADKYVSPSTMVNHPGVAKKWVNFKGSDATIYSSYEISGVSRTATGTYIITFSFAFANTNYGVVGNAGESGGGSVRSVMPATKNTGSCVVEVRNDAAALADATWIFVEFYHNE